MAFFGYWVKQKSKDNLKTKFIIQFCAIFGTKPFSPWYWRNLFWKVYSRPIARIQVAHNVKREKRNFIYDKRSGRPVRVVGKVLLKWSDACLMKTDNTLCTKLELKKIWATVQEHFICDILMPCTLCVPRKILD